MNNFVPKLSTNMHKLGMLSILSIFLTLSSNAHSDPRPFDKNSLSVILQEQANQSMLMVLWSIECAPCLEELELLSQLKQTHPTIKLVLISIDSFEQLDEQLSILNRNGLQQISSWAFVEGDSRALRYAIDPEWYGELPRSYFYNSQHQRQGVSGKLSMQLILDAFAQMN